MRWFALFQSTERPSCAVVFTPLLIGVAITLNQRHAGVCVRVGVVRTGTKEQHHERQGKRVSHGCSRVCRQKSALGFVAIPPAVDNTPDHMTSMWTALRVRVLTTAPRGSPSA